MRRRMRRFRKRGGRSVTARTVRKIVEKRIRRDTEVKYADFNDSGTGVDFSGTFIRVTNIAQGDSDTTRDGDKLTPVYLNVKWKVGVGDSTNIMRVIIFQWKQNILSISPTQAYLLAQTGSALSPISPYNWDTRSNFRVLKDFKVTVDSVNKPQVVGRTFLKLNKLEKVAFDAGGTNGNNQIYIYVVSDSGAASHPTWAMTARLAFTDS